MARLTARGRKRIKASNFALPGKRYPVHNKTHARAALAMVAKHGTPAEKKRVWAVVARKYPSITVSGRARTPKRRKRRR